MNDHIFKISILGAGPTGALLAIAMASFGSEVVIYDPKSQEELCSRSRAYALTNSSRIVFEKLGLWDDLTRYLTPFDFLCISDQEINEYTLFSPEDLPRNKSETTIGWIIDHNDLMSILLNTIASISSIKAIFDSKYHHNSYEYDLNLVADGPNSTHKRKLGIKSFKKTYSQSCLTAKVLIRGAKANTAYEVFRSEGPMAILPMGRDIFQIIWSAPTLLCKGRTELKSSVFLDRLASALPSDLQPDILLENPRYFPLEFSVSYRLSDGKNLLVGESGHRCHPIGGQGLNLCWRDVLVLMSLINKSKSGKIKLSEVPRKYSKSRILDVLMVGLITDLMVNVFSNRNFLLLLIRKIIFRLIQNSHSLRILLLRIMSYGPTSITRKLS